MVTRKFLEALVDSAFDRIESSLPPCTPKVEAGKRNLDSYRWGIIETVLATFQTLCCTQECWAMTDIDAACGLREAVQIFYDARMKDQNAPLPDPKPIVDKLLRAVENENER